MSSYAPGTPWNVIQENEKRLYGIDVPNRPQPNTQIPLNKFFSNPMGMSQPNQMDMLIKMLGGQNTFAGLGGTPNSVSPGMAGPVLGGMPPDALKPQVYPSFPPQMPGSQPTPFPGRSTGYPSFPPGAIPQTPYSTTTSRDVGYPPLDEPRMQRPATPRNMDFGNLLEVMKRMSTNRPRPNLPATAQDYGPQGEQTPYPSIPMDRMVQQSILPAFMSGQPAQPQKSAMGLGALLKSNAARKRR